LHPWNHKSANAGVTRISDREIGNGAIVEKNSSLRLNEQLNNSWLNCRALRFYLNFLTSIGLIAIVRVPEFDVNESHEEYVGNRYKEAWL